MVDKVVGALDLSDAGLLPVVDQPLPDLTRVLRVGPGEAFATLHDALAAARDGDLVLVKAGTYVDDFATVRAKVTIAGVGGMAHFVAQSSPPDGKAILTVDASCTIRNCEFSGAAVPDANGAGIRYEGGDLVLSNCSFHNNENGLLGAAAPDGSISIDHCDFGYNGNGSGYTHNLYVGEVRQLTVTNSYFHDVSVGHEIKSRALSSTIVGNVIADGPDSTASFSIDLPNGGADLVQGNIIEKGPQAENQSVIHFGGEGIPYAGSSLTISGNAFVNDRSYAVGVLNQTAIPVTVSDNTFSNFTVDALIQGPGKLTSNTATGGSSQGTGDSNGSAAATVIPDTTQVGVLPGATTFFTTDALPHSLTMTSSDTAVQGGAGHLTVIAQAGHVIAVGGAGGMDFTEMSGSGGNQIATAAGSVNSLVIGGQDAVDSEGTDTIQTGDGNVSAQIGGVATVSEGKASNQWNVTGRLRLTGHGGVPRITLTSASASASVDGSLDFLSITGNGGTASWDATIAGHHRSGSISGGAWQLTAYDVRELDVRTGAGATGAQIRLGDDDARIMSGGPDEIWGGAGALTVQASGASRIHAGTGTLAVFGRGYSGAQVFANGGATLLDGDTGGITYFGGDTDNQVTARLSSVMLVGGAGRMQVGLGSRQTVVGGSGGITVNRLSSGSGANSITTAAGSQNTLEVSNDLVDSWGADTVTEVDSWSGVTVHGAARILGGTGRNNLTVLGNASVVGRGTDIVSLMAGGAATIQVGQSLWLQQQGGAKLALAITDLATVSQASLGAAPVAPLTTATIEGTAASVSVGADRVANITTQATPGVAGGTIRVDGGTSVIQTGGSDTVYTGAGQASVTMGANMTTLWAGSGALEVRSCDWNGGDIQTIHGGSGFVHVAQHSDQLAFIAGSGDAVLDGTGAGTTVVGGSGRLTLNASGSNGALTYTGGSGEALLNLSPNGGKITFGQGDTTVNESTWGTGVTYAVTDAVRGTEVINNFRVGVDKVTLSNTNIASQVIGTDRTTVTTTNGATLVFMGVKQAVVSPPPIKLVLNLSEDTGDNDAYVQLTLNGKSLGDPILVTALHDAGATQSVVLSSNFNPKALVNLKVTFCNGVSACDDGSAANGVYIDSLTANGVKANFAGYHFDDADTELFSFTAPSTWS